MARGKPPRTRARASAKKATKSTPARSSNAGGGRGGGSRKQTKNGTSSATKSKSTKSSKSKDNRAEWDESDEEYYDRPEYYTDSSDDYDSDTSRRSPDLDFEDEAEDEEMEESSSMASRVPTPGTSICEADEYTECAWLEIPPEQLPVMELPKGSKDLLIDEKYIFDALEVYETCRWFYQAVRLSPFLFEDFCAALSAEGQTNLLAEVHIALLKLALKNDDDEQIILSVQDTNNSFNIMLQLLEPMTYGELLRQYLESDPQRFPPEVLKAASDNYPFVDVGRRLTVLLWLCDRFLQSDEFRNVVRNEGKLTADEHCRECGKPGDVLLCDGCEACYHLACTNLADVPDGKWLCQVCEIHKVRGVTDCDYPGHRSHRMPMRFKPLGYDRHGRRYWFRERRIFVQDDVDGSVHYYSTLPQLYALLNAFSVSDYEKHLAAVFMDILPTIDEHMRVTLQLSTEYGRSAVRRNKTDLYLHADNVVRMGDILAKPLYSQLRECDDERVIVVVGGTKHVEVSKYTLLCNVEVLLGFVDNCLRDTFWTAGMQTHEVISKKNSVEADFAAASINGNISEVHSPELGFRLGEGDTLTRYVNQYSVNEYAKNPVHRAKERDKKKYMCGRFSLMDEGEFEWTLMKGRSLNGTPSQIGAVIQNSLEAFAQKIPPVLMHRLWKRDGLDHFRKGLTAPATVELLKDLLLRFECAIRRPVLHSVFWNTLGHIRLMRITADDREKRQHLDAKKKKEERELLAADPDDEEVIWVKHRKVGSILKRTLWRQNDESYRVCGRGQLGGWLWHSRTFRRTFLPRAEKPTVGGKLEPTTLANQKAIRLEKVIQRLNQWRIAEIKREERKWQKELLKECYSPTCRMGMMPLLITAESDNVQGCYSPTCRGAVVQSEERTTSGIVHARPLLPSAKCLQENGIDEKVLGISKPFPLPVPFNYRDRRTGEQSLLILPQKALKRLARQGGVNSNNFAPGFHRMAKSNNQVWNYPCQRPLFDNCWRFLVLRAESYHSIAMHLRILYACVRWADIQRSPEDDLRVTTHLADHDEVRTVIGHRECPPDGMNEQYKISVQLIPLDENGDLEESDEGAGSAAYHPSKSLERTLRKRKATRKAVNGIPRRGHTKVVERWIEGVELKPWEIVDYWKGLENRAKHRPATPTVVTVGGRVSTPAVKLYEPPPAYLSRTSVEKRRPQPKRIPDYDYDVRDDELDEESEESEDEEYIDVETLPNHERKPSYEPKPKVPRLSEPRPDRVQVGSPYKAQWYNSNGQLVHVRPYEPLARQPGELRGGGKYTMLQKPDGTLCRVMVYPNRPTHGAGTTATGSPAGPSARAPIVVGSQSRIGTPQREPMRVPIARRLVTVPGSSQGSPAAPLGKRLLLIRRSDGTTQYLRPVSQPIGATGTPGTYRTLRATPAGGATISDIRGTPTSSSGIRPTTGNTRTVFTGNQSMGRIMRLPPRTVTLVGQSPVGSGSHPQSPAIRVSRMLPPSHGGVERPAGVAATHDYVTPPTVRRRPDGVEVLSDHYTGPATAQMDEGYRLSSERGLRPSERPSGTTLGSGTPRVVVGTTRPAVTVQPRQGLAAVVHPSLEQQSSSGQIFGDHDPMVGGNGSTGGATTARYPGFVRTAAGRTGIMIRHPGNEPGQARHFGHGDSYGKAKSVGQVTSPSRKQPVNVTHRLSGTREKENNRLAGLRRDGQSLYGRPLTSRLNELADAASAIGHNYASSLAHLRHVGTVDVRSNLYIVDDDDADVRAIKELLDGLITDVCIMDTEHGWHRRHIQRLYERRQQERHRREMELRAQREEQRAARELENDLSEEIERFKKEIDKRRRKLEQKAEAAAGMIAPWRRPRTRPEKRTQRPLYPSYYIAPTAELQSIAGMPVEPSTIPLGNITQSNIKTEIDEPQEGDRRAVQLPKAADDYKSTGLIPDLSGEQKPLESVPCQPASSRTEDTSAPRRSERSRRKRTWMDEEYITPDAPRPTSRTSSSSEAPSASRQQQQQKSGRSRREQRPGTSRDATPSASSRPGTESSPGSVPDIDTTKRHCKCNQPYDSKKFYIGCDLCYRWFHGKCVGISEKKSKKMTTWVCDDCAKEQKSSEQELYCVCQTPYDDSRFYVGCDGCEGWFHPQCVGITQEEAEKVAEYLCPQCVRNKQSGYESSTSSSSLTTLSRPDFVMLWQVFDNLKEHRTSWPFREAVDPEEHPNYYSIIKKPMDLSIVQRKLERCDYHHLKDFTADITQIFENARTFNPKDSAIYQCADILEKQFRERILEVKNGMETKNKDEPVLSSDNRMLDRIHGEDDLDPSALDLF